jgi:hypothetical protein
MIYALSKEIHQALMIVRHHISWPKATHGHTSIMYSFLRSDQPLTAPPAHMTAFALVVRGRTDCCLASLDQSPSRLTGLTTGFRPETASAPVESPAPTCSGGAWSRLYSQIPKMPRLLLAGQGSHPFSLRSRHIRTPVASVKAFPEPMRAHSLSAVPHAWPSCLYDRGWEGDEAEQQRSCSQLLNTDP